MLILNHKVYGTGIFIIVCDKHLAVYRERRVLLKSYFELPYNPVHGRMLRDLET